MQLSKQNQIKKLQKERSKETNPVAIRGMDRQIEGLEKDLETIEAPTDKGAQRKYASVLELGMNPKGFFNKNLNLAANTDAAKTIRANAKKGKPDKDWSDNMKKLLKEAGGETEGGDDDKGPGGGGPKGGGTGGGGTSGGSAGGGIASSGGGATPSGAGPAAGGGSSPSSSSGGAFPHASGSTGGGVSASSGSEADHYADLIEDTENRKREAESRVGAMGAAMERSRYRVRDVDTAETQAYAENARRDERERSYAQTRVGNVDTAETQARAMNTARDNADAYIAANAGAYGASRATITRAREDAMRSAAGGSRLVVPTSSNSSSRQSLPVDAGISNKFSETFKENANPKERGGRITESVGARSVPANGGMSNQFMETFKNDSNPDERGGRIGGTAANDEDDVDDEHRRRAA
jgi:hypothetical protein